MRSHSERSTRGSRVVNPSRHSVGSMQEARGDPHSDAELELESGSSPTIMQSFIRMAANLASKGLKSRRLDQTK